MAVTYKDRPRVGVRRRVTRRRNQQLDGQVEDRQVYRGIPTSHPALYTNHVPSLGLEMVTLLMTDRFVYRAE
jgi:hypothetical protein